MMRVTKQGGWHLRFYQRIQLWFCQRLQLFIVTVLVIHDGKVGVPSVQGPHRKEPGESGSRREPDDIAWEDNGRNEKKSGKTDEGGKTALEWIILDICRIIMGTQSF